LERLTTLHIFASHLPPTVGCVLDFIRTLLVPDNFLALITNAFTPAVDAIRKMDVNFIGRLESTPMYEHHGVQYYSTWSVTTQPFLLV
jgi:hypothetical protein